MIPEKYITILTPTRNSSAYTLACLQSAASQSYDNYEHIFIDDCSDDNTFEIAANFRKEYPQLQLYKNAERKFSTCNIRDGNTKARDDSIIVILDGDDWFKHDNVLNVVNRAYDDNVWMTYGSYENHPYIDISHVQIPYPESVVRSNSFRDYPLWLGSHLRTWRRSLFERIDPSHFKDENGMYLDATGDLATMFPMLEMSGVHSRRISDILYVYNTTNPLCDFKQSATRQNYLDYYIRNLPKYLPLTSLH